MTMDASYVGLPPADNPDVVGVRNQFQALDNFTRLFAIRPCDRV